MTREEVRGRRWQGSGAYVESDKRLYEGGGSEEVGWDEEGGSRPVGAPGRGLAGELVKSHFEALWGLLVDFQRPAWALLGLSSALLGLSGKLPDRITRQGPPR